MTLEHSAKGDRFQDYVTSVEWFPSQWSTFSIDQGHWFVRR